MANMTSYQVLDLQRALLSFGDEENARNMINTFAMDRHFKEIVENYHRDIMGTDFEGLRGSGDSVRGVFGYFASSEMKGLIFGDMKEAIDKKDEQKLIHLHLIFLRKCEILRRELEDYLQTTVPSADIKECVEECLKELKKKGGVTEIEGKAKHDASSCAGCSIF